MAKLKLSEILDDRPVKLAIELPAVASPGPHGIRGGAGSHHGPECRASKAHRARCWRASLLQIERYLRIETRNAKAKLTSKTIP